MASIKRRDATWTTAGGGKQVYIGPGTLLYAVMDGTSLSSNVLTLYDSDRANTADPTIATWTQDTDFGTTVPVTCFGYGSIVATMATEAANVHVGIPFANGLYIVKTGDTTHTAACKFLIKPLIKKSCNLGHGATTDSQRLFTGPGILHAVRISVPDVTVRATGTLDVVFKDSTRTIWTATDYVTEGPSDWFATTTTGVDDTGTARTTAATGSYANPGIAFVDSLNVTAAQGDASYLNAQIDALIEA
jgi:hypothetical protein